MTPERRLPLLLGALGASVLALMVTRGGISTLWPTAAPGGADMPTETSPTDSPAPRGPAFPDVNLEGLAIERIEPADGGRNPFSLSSSPRTTFSAAPPRFEAPVVTREASEEPGAAIRTTPPIPLKFIGIVSLTRNRGRLAVLSDGDFVYHGRRGDIVEGRYRIITIGDESIELEYTDGRGRQSLPLAGS